MSTDPMTLIIKAQIDRDAKGAGIVNTVRQGHPPIETKPDDWPGCSGLLRLYRSGNMACDCGDVVIKAADEAAMSTDIQPGDVIRYDGPAADELEPVSPPWARRTGREFVVVEPVTGDGRVVIWDPEFHGLGGGGDTCYPRAEYCTVVRRSVPVEQAASLAGHAEAATEVKP